MASDAMITRIIELGRRRMIAREAMVTASLLDAYERSWRSIERDLKVLQQQYRAAVAQGMVPPDEWLTRQVYWYGLQSSIEQEIVRFEGDALRIIEAGQRMAVTEASDTAASILADLGLSGSGGALRGETMERWISAQQPESPLRKVLDCYPTDILHTITNEITEGLGTGRGSSTVIRRIEAAIGPDAMTPRIMATVRTEMHRTYRAASAEAMKAQQERGIITAYRWVSAKSIRTCIACIAMDGRIFDTYPMSQHVNCRCTVAPVVNPKYLPGPSRERETASEWFAKQDEKTQRRMMPTPGHFDMYREGKPLSDFVGTRHNDTWGDSVAIRPVRAMRAE